LLSSKEYIRAGLCKYGPQFQEILVPMRMFYACVLVQISSWELPDDLLKRCLEPWAELTDIQKAPLQSTNHKHIDL